MAEADAGIAACCGLCAYSALANWCIIHPFGADVRCGGGPRGCCGSCCDSSFNEDNFDERMKKEQARNGANAEPVGSQPVPSHVMCQVTSDPKSTNVEA
ncbi:hypothetical protein J3R82DRAFT_8039 [Butyriboletus roseoflavus]|nr:hypothetical protein J3R82DRAFT_8039 [Butyriboletus roseoflavus]